VQAFQHHAKVGEVCPLGWKPGDDTIQEDAQGKMKFFKKHH
jgi:alkyl hydroperoxide reductase subunit AhpC